MGVNVNKINNKKYMKNTIHTHYQEIKKQFEEKTLRFCSRCGKEWCVLGKVLKWGKHYPAYTIKKADGTKDERPADDEIKEAVCRDCAKEIFDNSFLQSALVSQLEEVERVVEGKIAEELKAKPADDLEKTAEWYKVPALKDLLLTLRREKEIITNNK